MLIIRQRNTLCKYMFRKIGRTSRMPVVKVVPVVRFANEQGNFATNRYPANLKANNRHSRVEQCRE